VGVHPAGRATTTSNLTAGLLAPTTTHVTTLPLPQVNDLLTGSPVDDGDSHVTNHRPPEDQPVLVHHQIDLLTLGGVEGDRQVIAWRDEPIPAFRLEERSKTCCVIRARKPDYRDMPMSPALAGTTLILVHEIIVSNSAAHANDHLLMKEGG
jgi:hypothetical protein